MNYFQQIADKFDSHYEVWKSYNRASSLVDEICGGPDYIAILEIGTDVVPFILMNMAIGETDY